MAILSTDFQNEIINETINTKRKYFMTDNDDGTVSFTDNTSYTQAGTEYGAEEIIEEREQINQHTNVIGSDEFNPESSYYAGDYFIYNNKLCKALSAISAGAALSLGSNYQVTSIKDELSGLNENKISGVPMTTENIIEAADSIPVGRICFFFLSGGTHVSLSPLPNNYKFGTAIVSKRNTKSKKIILFPEDGIYQPVSKNASSGEWGEWIYFDGTKV